MRVVVVSCLVLVASCSSHDHPASVDAAVDAPSGGPCTGATYDPCATNDQCTSNNCHFFMMSNITVCVPPCTPGDNTTCPIDGTGQHGFCSNVGICKPATPNNCTR